MSVCRLRFLVLSYRLFLYLFHLQTERNFYHFGTKFLKFKLRLPIYLVGPSIRFKTLLTKFPDSHELNFIQFDMERFINLFDEDKKQRESYESKLRFHSITEDNNNYALLPDKQKKASDLNMSTLKDWGLFTRGTERKSLHPCTREDHGLHHSLLPFHKTNRDLLRYYQTLGDSRTEDLKKDQELLLKVQNNTVNHLETKFYCSGLPFGDGENY